MILPSALPHSAPAAPEPVAEERVIFLSAPERADRVLLGEQALSVFADRQRTPYIEQLTAAGVHIRLTDWVGRLPFRLIGERSVTEHEVTVYPAKLARDPEAAFAALGQMLVSVAEWERQLGLASPGESAVGAVAGPPRRPEEAAAELRAVGEEAWKLAQTARRLPGLLTRFAGKRERTSAGERRVAGGQVPDRVDWSRTLELWGRGGFAQHVALDLPAPPLPVAAPALLELWSALIHAAQTLPEGPVRRDLLGRFDVARAALWRLGRVEGRERADDPVSRRARDLTERVHALTRQTPGSTPGQRAAAAGGAPRGSVRMAELYEFWAQLTLARALGAQEGEVTRTPDGTGQGTLRGQVPGHNGGGEAQLTVTLNPRLAFGGVGPASQTLQPDLLALLGEGASGQVLVADAKYRPLDRLSVEAQREINDQLLRYMGLLHAPTGLILWPGLGAEAGAERCRVSVLPGGRARLVRLRLHPADPPGQLAADLRRLGLLWGPEVGSD